MSANPPLLPARYVSQVALSGVINGVASALCAVLALPLLVSLLGMEGYGEWAVLHLFITAGAALDLGLSRAIVLHCSGRPAALVAAHVTTSLRISGLLALAATLLIVALSLATGRLMGLAATALDPALLAGGCAILCLGMLNAVLRAALESQMAAQWVNLGYLLQTLLFYGLSLLAAWLWPAGIVLGAVLAMACVLCLQLAALRRTGLRLQTRASLKNWSLIWRSSLQSYVLAAPPALLPPIAAALVLGHATDATTFAVFDLANRIATLAATLLSSIAVPVLALAARAHGTGLGHRELPHWVRRYLMAGWGLFAAGLLFWWQTGPLLLSWLFPDAGSTLFPLSLLLLGGLGAVAASEPAMRAMLGGPGTAPVLIARLALCLGVIGPGAWLLHRDGLLAFGATYLAGGLIAAAILLLSWQRRSRSTSPATGQ